MRFSLLSSLSFLTFCFLNIERMQLKIKNGATVRTTAGVLLMIVQLVVLVLKYVDVNALTELNYLNQ